jgi:hypothetical protein
MPNPPKWDETEEVAPNESKVPKWDDTEDVTVKKKVEEAGGEEPSSSASTTPSQPSGTNGASQTGTASIGLTKGGQKAPQETEAQRRSKYADIGNKLAEFNKKRTEEGKSAQSTGAMPAEMAAIEQRKKQQKMAEKAAAVDRSNKAEKNVGKSLLESAAKYVTEDLPDLAEIGASLIAQPTYTTPYGISVETDEQYQTDPESWDKRKQQNISRTVTNYLKTDSEKPKKEYIDQLSEVQDGLDFLNYLSTTIGKTVPQMAVAGLTSGASSFLETSSSVYLDGVQKKAEDTGRTVEDIIESGDDKGEVALATGIVSAGLDMIGLGKLAKGAAGNLLKEKVGKSFGKKVLNTVKEAAKGATSEAPTEGLQTVAENIGSNVQSGRSATDNALDGALESAVQGGVAGGAVRGASAAIGNTINNGGQVQDDAQREAVDATGAQQDNAAPEQQEPPVQPIGEQANKGIDENGKTLGAPVQDGVLDKPGEKDKGTEAGALPQKTTVDGIINDSPTLSEAARTLNDNSVELAAEAMKEPERVVEQPELIQEPAVAESEDATIEASEKPKKGEKSLLSRAYKGQAEAQVREAIAKHGLTYNVESFIEAKSIADDIISEIGLDNAVEAASRFEIRGAPAAVILGKKADELQGRIMESDNAEETAGLISEQSDVINMFDSLSREGGQFNSILQDIYESSEFNYSFEKQSAKFKEANGGVIPVEVEQKMKLLDSQLKEVTKQLQESEEKAQRLAEQAAVDSIKADLNKTPKTRRGKILIAEGLDEIAEAIGARLMAVDDKRATVIGGLVKIGRGMIDEGIATLDNVSEKLRSFIKEKLGGKLDYDQYSDDVYSGITEERVSGSKVKIKQSIIRELVENGNEEIDELVGAVKGRIKNEYPDATDRDIRDAITQYGRTVNPSQNEVDIKIRKMKRIGRLISALEDVRAKKRPLKSGAQRDKIGSDERAMMKELREAMKELPMDLELQEKQLKTAMDGAKQRLRNQIEDLNREIANNEQVPRSARTVKYDEELEELRKTRDEVKKRHDEIFKDDDFKEAKRLEIAKRNAEKKIADLERRVKERDFSKKTRAEVLADRELDKLRVRKLEIKDEFDALQYENELKNRTKAKKAADAIWEIWGLTRALRATGEMSFVLLQGGIQTFAHPKTAAKAFVTAMSHLGSEKRSMDWLRELRTKDYYQRMKESKLALSEPDSKLSKREEMFLGGWVNHIWDILGQPFRIFGSGAYEKWKNINPIKAIERAGVGYMNTLRAERYLQGEQMLEMQGKSIQKDKEDFKNMADVINTLTGRASLGPLEGQSKLLSTIFFSPRNWASTIKTTTPYALYYFGRMTTRDSQGRKRISVAQKMAIADLMKWVGLTGAFVGTAAAYYNNDDDEETGVELDPTSSDFMKIKIGNTSVDPWGGKIQHIVLQSRLLMDSMKKSDGKEYQLGKGSTSTRFDLAFKMATNKLAPSASLLYNFANSKVTKKNGEYVRVAGFDKKEYDAYSEIANNLYPIYAESIMETYNDQPDTVATFLMFMAFFGMGVNTYESKKQKKH